MRIKPLFAGVVFAAAFVLAIFLAQMQDARAQIGHFGFQGISAYRGPGDVRSGWKFWGGVRAFSNAMAGMAAINACDNTGANCADIATSPATGILNNVTLGSNNCVSTGTCRVKKIYDQTGNGLDCVQTTTSQMPTLSYTGLGGILPSLIFSAANSNTCRTGIVTLSQPYAYTMVTYVNGGTSLNEIFGDDVHAIGVGGNAPSIAHLGVYAATFVGPSAANGAWHAFNATVNAASTIANLDGGVSSPGNPGTQGFTTHVDIGADAGTSSFLDGRIAEYGVNASALTSTDLNNLCHNQYQFGGLSLSC